MAVQSVSETLSTQFNNPYLDASLKLYEYLITAHFKNGALVGPDVGVRFNSRVGRFVKSYLSLIPWSDDYCYLQAQGYWIMDNWMLFDMLREERYAEIARKSSLVILGKQTPAGYWDYPNPEWRGRIATVEGDFAALGLLETYRRTEEPDFLDGALRWYNFLTTETGFQAYRDGAAVNYFANVPGSMVPNNSTLTLMLLGKLFAVIGDHQYLAHASGMVRFLRYVQMESGELPYAVGRGLGRDRPHFLCYQYNAFELLDLASYFHDTSDQRVLEIMKGLAAFLSEGLTDTGSAKYNCYKESPEVIYYTAAVGAALLRASQMGLGDFTPLVERAYESLLSNQIADGGFIFFSRRNYRVLTDRRSYPRPLAMILNHLLLKARSEQE